jgi:hypothetical protein
MSGCTSGKTAGLRQQQQQQALQQVAGRTFLQSAFKRLYHCQQAM